MFYKIKNDKFKGWWNNFNKEVDLSDYKVYLVGAFAENIYGAKIPTMDVDIVLRNEVKDYDKLKEILDTAHQNDKELVVYLSMAFGNPYGDPWDVDIVGEWTEKLQKMGVKILSLSDTIGSSSRSTISYLFSFWAS